jgi:hypothetical protein
MFGKLMSAYAQRAPDGERHVPRSRRRAENGDPGPGPTAPRPPRRSPPVGVLGVALRRNVDSASPFLWLDGQAMTGVDAVGFGKQCQGRASTESR